jgi:two-component system, OmpR family, aerobic respiration control sensor histidine kinase ArcB
MTLSGLRVLLAEDNPTNQLVATQMLECLGASVILAEDGAEALEIIDRETFDVMLVDIEMPRVNGIEVLRTVRGSSGPISEVPMIALTAYVMREHRAAIDAAGADGVIAKPILSIEQFGTDIRRFMRRRTDISGAEGAQPRTMGDEAPCVVDPGIYDALAEVIGSAAMTELLSKVSSDIQAMRDRLVAARNPPDHGEISSATHILISVAGAIGALRLQEGAKQMNSASLRIDTTGVEDDFQGLLAEIEHVLEFVRSRSGD